MCKLDHFINFSWRCITSLIRVVRPSDWGLLPICFILSLIFTKFCLTWKLSKWMCTYVCLFCLNTSNFKADYQHNQMYICRVDTLKMFPSFCCKEHALLSSETSRSILLIFSMENWSLSSPSFCFPHWIHFISWYKQWTKNNILSWIHFPVCPTL